ncbi:MAG: 30S ribosomal protein S14 [Gammaproteobacteria bacterium]|nr:30S ribosomal protein S14 [Gammaproteobacteria bacterium]
MAKKSMVERERRRLRAVERHRERRAALKRIIKDRSASPDALADALQALQRLPRDSSPSRLRNRCAITGRPRGYFKKFGLSRNKLREETMFGNIPGVSKASW